MRKNRMFGWICVAVAGMALNGWAATKYLDEFDLSSMTCGLGGRPQARKSLLGNAIRLGDKTFTRGVGTHADSVMIFDTDGNTTAFDAVVGIDKEALDYKGWDCGKGWGSVSFRVYADGKKVADSGIIKITDAPKAFHADLTGAKTIVLEVADGGEWAGYRFGHGDWGDAKFTVKDDTVKLEPTRDESLTEQYGILTPPEGPKPQINGPSVFGVRPGHPILYLIPVSGERPLKITVNGLPPGAKFDAATGILSGAVAKSGDYPLTIFAQNAKGKAVRMFLLRVGEKIALTPPLGWNSWNVWGSSVSDQKVRAAADVFHNTGLDRYGWSYIVIDDWWQNRPGEKSRKDVMGPCRTSEGKIVPNANFPDMKILANYVHAYGYKIGLYSSPGPTTCGGCEASWKHEKLDAETYAEWGYDYLKYDWCSYGQVAGKDDQSREYASKPYELMGRLLRQQNRDIFFALCQYGMAHVAEWGESIGGNSWRTKGDLKDSWQCVVQCIDTHRDDWKYAHPGCWNDPDMMVLGWVSTAGGPHYTYLTPNEQYSHMSLWVLQAAPIMLGCDLTKLDPFTRNLLVNREVLEIHQDELGQQARSVFHEDATDIWVKMLADGNKAIGVVNRYPFKRKVSFRFSDVGLVGKQLLRDVWRQKDIGVLEGSYEVSIPPHYTELLRTSHVGF